MNEARYKFHVVSCGKFMLVIGDGDWDEISKSTERYDDVTDKWTLSTSMIGKRFGHFFF